MSYILDALRKSEQERLRGKLPDLKNFGDEDQRMGGNHRLAWIIGGALLALNAVGISVWLMRTPNESAQVVAASSSKADSALTSNASATSGANQVSASTPAQATPTPTAVSPGQSPVTSPAPNAVVAGQAGYNQNPQTTPVVNAGQAVAGVPVVQGTPITATPTAVVSTTPPAGTVYYVTQGSAVPGQQIVVLPSGVMPAGVVQGGVVQGGVIQGAPAGNVVVMPSVNQPAAQSWDNTGVAVPPPVPPPPPPVNLDETLDAAGVSANPTISYLPQLDELPAQIRQQVPDMAFSSHMFSSMAKFRSVVINGNRVKEGQMVGNNIQVREITETGVILSVGETQFQVDVLGKWSQ